VIPPEENAAFVWRMEDVLDVYHRPQDPKRPLVCLDERAVQLLGEVREPEPVKSGKPRRVDYEYERNGVANVFLAYAPLEGKRQVWVRKRRGKAEWAEVIQALVDEHYPEAERIVLVQDNLNTHTPASLYGMFPPQEAKRLTEKLELHYTPTHGSWLNMAEIDLSVLGRQCLSRRLPGQEALDREAQAWAERRNALGGKTDWRFTTQDARIKLKHLYPSLQG